jgi:hypothetical protein
MGSLVAQSPQLSWGPSLTESARRLNEMYFLTPSNANYLLAVRAVKTGTYQELMRINADLGSEQTRRIDTIADGNMNYFGTVMLGKEL